MQIVRCHRGQQLLRPGVPPEALYVLQSGQMSLKDGSKAGRALKPGDYFGEEALEGRGRSTSAPAGCRARREAGGDGGARLRARAHPKESFNRHVGALQEIARAHFNERCLGSITGSSPSPPPRNATSPS